MLRPPRGEVTRPGNVLADSVQARADAPACREACLGGGLHTLGGKFLSGALLGCLIRLRRFWRMRELCNVSPTRLYLHELSLRQLERFTTRPLKRKPPHLNDGSLRRAPRLGTSCSHGFFDALYSPVENPSIQS
jgi:hypothetical protein